MYTFLMSSCCKISLRRLCVSFNLDPPDQHVLGTKKKKKGIRTKLILRSPITFCQPSMQIILENTQTMTPVEYSHAIIFIHSVSVVLILGKMITQAKVFLWSYSPLLCFDTLFSNDHRLSKERAKQSKISVVFQVLGILLLSFPGAFPY